MTTEDQPHEGEEDAGAAAPETDEGSDEHREGLTERLTHQLQARIAERQEAMLQERQDLRASIPAGRTNVSPAHVPWGVDLAAAWAWRFLVIAVAGYVIIRVLAFFAVVTLPLIIALFITALVGPLVRRLVSVGVPQALGAIVVVVGFLALVGALLTFAGQQVANGADDLADQVVKGLDDITNWLKDGPLNASDSQINDVIARVQEAITEQSQDGETLSQVTEVGTAIGHVLAGFFIVLFASYFFLADGSRIWAWVVRLAPRAARARIDSSGRVAWISLTQFVRATVIVAAADALGIMIVAAILDVPFVFAIGVLVFLGAFIPMVGGAIAGTVAVLVALVDEGVLIALLMLGGVILVQQIEGHVLQPFVMGRFVSVHPLGVIVAIGCGVLVAGIAGALIAVPIAATLNAVVQHLASDTEIGEDEPEEALEEDVGEVGDEGAPPVPDNDAPTGSDEGASRD